MGRTLTPVEAIRRRAEDITGSRLQQRVPEPAPRRDRPAGPDDQRGTRSARGQLQAAGALRGRCGARAGDAVGQSSGPAGSGDGPNTSAATTGCSPSCGSWPAGWTCSWNSCSSWRGATPVPSRCRRSRWISRIWSTRVITTCRFSAGPVRKARFEPVQVLGEPALLELVVRNLLDNAVRHSTSTVEVSLFAQDGRALLVVEDDGPGIAPSHRSEVFVRFVRLDDARSRKPGGAGLGLSIVKEIAAVHGGTVEASRASAVPACRCRCRWSPTRGRRDGSQASSGSRASVEPGAAASRARGQGIPDAGPARRGRAAAMAEKNFRNSGRASSTTSIPIRPAPVREAGHARTSPIGPHSGRCAATAPCRKLRAGRSFLRVSVSWPSRGHRHRTGRWGGTACTFAGSSGRSGRRTTAAVPVRVDEVVASLAAFETVPDWLAAGMSPERVGAALC